MPFSIILGDITQSHVDAIVNAADPTLLGGSGVDGAIHRAAGPELLAECRTLGGCAPGEAKITRAYRLPCRYVIHTPGPIWQGGGKNEPEILRRCYHNALRLAVEYNCKTVDFPSISTGVYRFPLPRAAHIALLAIMDFLCDHPTLDVRMVCHTEETLRAYKTDWNMFYQETKPEND